MMRLVRFRERTSLLVEALVRSALDTEVGASPDLPVTPPPLTRPNTTMATLRAMRMMRLVRFRERTSLLVEALETTSRAVSSRGALSAAVRAIMAEPRMADLEIMASDG